MFSNREVVLNAMLAALYFALTSLTVSISFMQIQFRFAELLILFCFFNRKYVWGVTLGCFLANLVSPLGLVDVAFGTLATLLSALLISFSRHLLLALIYPVLINGFVVGLMLYFLFEAPFWLSFAGVCAGEAVVMIIGYVVFMLLKKNRAFFKTIGATRMTDFKF
ncbi:MAG: QueT transporter family protein [Erysipelotrichaceae bacterium]|jgi:uncharacterized membrane protein|nr:QueT transporter family protein [Erysipelotrichaceae bacterium]